MKLLLEELWPDKNKTNIKSIPPKEFKKKISKMSPLFRGISQNNAKDLITFLLMTLHSELNISRNDNITNNIINDDQTNKDLAFQIFYNDFIIENMSIISDLFIAINYSITQCGNCSIKSYNFETYFFLVFPLEEVRKFKSQNNYNNYGFNNNEVNIYDYFYYEQRINYLTGQNNMYCNYCGQICPSSIKTILYTYIIYRTTNINYNIK